MMDIEKAREIDTSQNWAEICAELDDWIEAELSKLRICISDDLRDLQLTIKVLEKVKSLPKIVIEREEG